MKIEIKQNNRFKYIDEGSGSIVMLLHGLFGELSNWSHVIDFFTPKYRVIIPHLPIQTSPLRQTDLKYLRDFLSDFIEHFDFKEINLVGNSLGGHIALMYTLQNSSRIKSLALTGSSGLFENGMGGSFPRRGNYEYIKERVAYTFYNPNTATKELIDEIFEVTKDTMKCLKIVAIAKSAQRHNMSKDIPNIQVPTLLVWGLNDTITPPFVAHEFNRLIPKSELRFIDKCCHAPMMEQPEKFNTLLLDFLDKNIS